MILQSAHPDPLSSFDSFDLKAKFVKVTFATDLGVLQGCVIKWSLASQSGFESYRKFCGLHAVVDLQVKVAGNNLPK